MIDLRHRVLRFTELRRRRDAHMPLTEAETAELSAGIPADEYIDIIEQIRHERRSAAPSSKATRGKAERSKAASATADLSTFLTTENPAPLSDEARKKGLEMLVKNDFSEADLSSFSETEPPQ